jgi:hypothetical protein
MKEQVFLVRNGLGDGHKTQAKNGLFISDSWVLWAICFVPGIWPSLFESDSIWAWELDFHSSYKKDQSVWELSDLISSKDKNTKLRCYSHSSILDLPTIVLIL